jgi:hypothetical protein
MLVLWWGHKRSVLSQPSIRRETTIEKWLD